MKVKKNKPKLVDNFEEIAVGDIVFIDCDGPCSGGARYDVGDKVIEVKTRVLKTADQSFSRKTGLAASEPWAYYIDFWQKA